MQNKTSLLEAKIIIVYLWDFHDVPDVHVHVTFFLYIIKSKKYATVT